MLKRGCSACRAELAAYLDHELGSVGLRRVAAHLAGCAECREELDLLRACQENMRAWEPVECSADFERLFWNRLSGLRRDVRPERPGFIARFLLSLRPRLALAATAVCALLVVVAGVVGLRHDGRLPPDKIPVAWDMELFMNMEVIQNSEALEHFDLISLLDVLGGESDE
jgi:anti-sigma factor RsiW